MIDRLRGCGVTWEKVDVYVTLLLLYSIPNSESCMERLALGIVEMTIENLTALHPIEATLISA